MDDGLGRKGKTVRMGRRDIVDALDYLRRIGHTVHAAPEPEVKGKYDILWSTYHLERMSARDLWMMVRGMRESEHRAREAKIMENLTKEA